MIEAHEIKEYRYSIRSTQASSILATLALTGESDTLVGAGLFLSDDTTLIPAPIKTASDIIILFYRLRELPTIIDMLRNENPVFLNFNDDPLVAGISTQNEPVGEEEMDRLLESIDD